MKLIACIRAFIEEILSFSRIKSIRNKFAIPVLFVAALVLIAGGIFQYINNRNEYLNELNDSANTVLQLAALANKDPLWNYNMDGLKANGEALFKDQDVCLIEIRNSEGKVLFHKIRAGDTAKARYLFIKEQPVVNQNQSIGTVKIGMTTFHYQEKMRKQLYTNLIMVFLTFFLLWIAISYVSILVAKGINRIITNVAEAAKGDLTHHIDITSQDEIGMLADGFNSMTGSLREMILRVTNVAQTLAASSEEYFALSETSKSTVQEILAGSREIARQTEKESHHMVEIDTLIQETTKSMNQVAGNSAEASVLSNNSYRVAMDSCITIEKAINKIQDISKSVDATIDTVTNLTQLSEKITGFVDIIKNISRQVQLLGLNAAIEAARAGEYGKGFGVVAQEIHNLSEQSTAATKQITELVKEINSAITSSVSMMAVVSQGMSEEKGMAGNAEEALQQIVSATEKVVENVQHIENTAAEQATNSTIVSKKIQEVSGISQSTAAGAQEAFSTMENYTTTIDEIITAAESLAKTADELITVTGHFKY